MITLNFFGDFVAPIVNNITIGTELKSVLENGTYNIVNCEVPCIGPDVEKIAIKKSGPTHLQDSATPKWLVNNKFNVFSLANNHMMDYGEEGLEYTRAGFNGEAVMGAGDWDEAYAPQILDCEGKKIAIYALTQYEFGTLGDYYTDKKGVAWINNPAIIGRIIETRKQVDYLYIFAHAGVENIEQPLPEWREIYKRFIDIGCDGVIASHPHIIQGFEYYKEKPIVYSLGNFYFKTKVRKNVTWYRSLSFSIQIKDNTIDYNVTPLVFNDECVNVDTTQEVREYIERINRTLLDDVDYISYINKECDKLLNFYYELFLAGGLLRVNKIHKIVKPFAKRLLRGKGHEIVHLINNIRCESHRWAILRALKNKHNIL